MQPQYRRPSCALRVLRSGRLCLPPGLLAGLLVTAFAWSACKGGGGGGDGDVAPGCPPGQQNCPCKTDGTCDAGLACTDNFCVPGTPCPEGSAGCPCYPNGTCDGDLACQSNVCETPRVVPGGLHDPCDDTHPCGSHEGTALECRSGTCELPVVCEPGTLGCPCAAGDTCGSHEGTALVCTAGTCQVPGCPTGTLDCPCGPGDTCGEHEGTALVCTDGTCRLATCPAGQIGCPCGPDDSCGSHEGTALVCTAGTCQLPGCPAGTNGCPCTAQGGCDTGLECQANVCGPPAALRGVTVGNAAVRACGLVIELPAADVRFADTVTGASKRLGDRLALSFTAKGDAAFAAPVAAIVDGAGAPLNLAGVTPTEVECFDRHGAAVANPGLGLQ